MENKNQDQLVQDLINHLILVRVFDRSEYQIFNNLSHQEWHELSAFVLEHGFMKEHDEWIGYFESTPKCNLLGEDLYIKQVQEQRIQQQKKEERERKLEERFDLEMKQLKRQVKVFWISLAISILSISIAIASYFRKSSEAVIKYIPIDSKGQIHELPEEKGI
jgi:hypothetical protein